MVLLNQIALVFSCMVCVLVPGIALADDSSPPSDPSVRTQSSLDHPVGTEPPRARWSSEGIYSAMGLAPASTLHVDGFNPALRYDFELGMHWVRGRSAVFVGADARILQYFGRNRPGGGVDGVLTVSRGPVYGRLGAGVVTGVPSTRDVHDAPPAIGGLVGFGLQGRAKSLVGRIGVDYDVRIDTTGRINQTVFFTLRFVFGF